MSGCGAAFSHPERLDEDVDSASIAEQFEISGGSIVNVLRSASLLTCEAAEAEFNFKTSVMEYGESFEKTARPFRAFPKML